MSDNDKAEKLENKIFNLENRISRIENVFRIGAEIVADTKQTLHVNLEEDDELINKAEAIVIQYDRASASLLQRRLSVGYARAARIIDLLEKRGVVGPAKGANPRRVLAKSSKK